MLTLITDEGVTGDLAADSLCGHPVLSYVIANCMNAGCGPIFGRSNHHRVKRIFEENGIPCLATRSTPQNLIQDQAQTACLIVAADAPFLGDTALIDAWNLMKHHPLERIQACYEASHPLSWFRTLDEAGISRPFKFSGPSIANRQDEPTAYVTSRCLGGVTPTSRQVERALLLRQADCYTINTASGLAYAQYLAENGANQLPILPLPAPDAGSRLQSHLEG